MHVGLSPEAMWLDQLGVDFTRWEFTLTPGGEHIARASIYLQDSNAVSELLYDAVQKCIPERKYWGKLEEGEE